MICRSDIRIWKKNVRDEETGTQRHRQDIRLHFRK